MALPLTPEEHQRRKEARAAGEAAGLSKADIARALGLSPNTYVNWNMTSAEIDARQDRRNDPAIQAAMDRIGMLITPRSGWLKTEPDADGLSASLHFTIKPEDGPSVLDRLADAFDNITAAPLIRPPVDCAADLMTAYIVTDLHGGMMAWGRETRGPDYDLKLASQDLRQGLQTVMARTMPSDTALLIFNGDTIHIDDNSAETPAHRNKLEVDGRYEKVVGEIADGICDNIERALEKHRQVEVVVMRGNHDPHAHIALRMGIAGRYRNEPRMTVWRDPFDIYSKQWGDSALWANHGDRSKPVDLVLELADKTPFYSTSRFRYVYLGHRHRDWSDTIGRTKIFGLNAAAPADSYGSKFSGQRTFYASTFDKRAGLIQTNFDMLGVRQAEVA